MNHKLQVAATILMLMLMVTLPVFASKPANSRPAVGTIAALLGVKSIEQGGVLVQTWPNQPGEDGGSIEGVGAGLHLDEPNSDLWLIAYRPEHDKDSVPFTLQLHIGTTVLTGGGQELGGPVDPIIVCDLTESQFQCARHAGKFPDSLIEAMINARRDHPAKPRQDGGSGFLPPVRVEPAAHFADCGPVRE